MLLSILMVNEEKVFLLSHNKVHTHEVFIKNKYFLPDHKLSLCKFQYHSERRKYYRKYCFLTYIQSLKAKYLVSVEIKEIERAIIKLRVTKRHTVLLDVIYIFL